MFLDRQKITIGHREQPSTSISKTVRVSEPIIITYWFLHLILIAYCDLSTLNSSNQYHDHTLDPRSNLSINRYLDPSPSKSKLDCTWSQQLLTSDRYTPFMLIVTWIHVLAAIACAEVEVNTEHDGVPEVETRIACCSFQVCTCFLIF